MNFMKKKQFFLVCMSVKHLLGYKTKSDDTEKSFRNKDRQVKQLPDLFNSMQKVSTAKSLHLFRSRILNSSLISIFPSSLFRGY